MDNIRMVIDTGIFIEYLRAKDKKKTILQNIPDNSILYVSAITLYELYIGATDNMKWYDIIKLTEDLSTLPFTRQIAEKSAKIFQELKKQNKMIEFRDIFIGATAIVHNLPLKTTNTKHFERIKELEIIKS